MVRTPWGPTSFASSADARRAVYDLFNPLVPAYRAGGARVSLGTAGIQLEAFARSLWGIVPLAAGGGHFPHWDLFRIGLVHGTDPRDPQYWGSLERTNQRMVEMAAIGFALALVPEEGPGRSQRVQSRSVCQGIAVTAQRVGAVLIGHEEQHTAWTRGHRRPLMMLTSCLISSISTFYLRAPAVMPATTWRWKAR